MTPRRALLALLVAACAAVAAPSLAVAQSSQDGTVHTDRKVGRAPKQPARVKLRAIKPVVGASKARIGIADQTATPFEDQRFRGLGIRYARRSVAWDTMRYDWQVEDVRRWVDGARAAGAEPLITFARSRVSPASRRAPTPAEFGRAFRAFRQRFPSVRTYSAWNEANHCGERTCRLPSGPRRVASYYKAIKASCRGCKVLAADLLDMPNMISWVLAFKKAARTEPRYWGLHNYVSANRFDVAATTALLQNTAGEVWITETGGLVSKRNEGVRLQQGSAHAARVTRFLFTTLARLSNRVTRLYLYHWKNNDRQTNWDSAFVGPDDRTRPSLGVLEGFIGARRAGARR